MLHEPNPVFAIIKINPVNSTIKQNCGSAACKMLFFTALFIPTPRSRTIVFFYHSNQKNKHFPAYVFIEEESLQAITAKPSKG
jgi:hypothetical protein